MEFDYKPDFARVLWSGAELKFSCTCFVVVDAKLVIVLQTRLVNISSDHIVDGNPKMTLAFVWSIIQRWQVCVDHEIQLI